jgi:mono/diheme cytochrome c family protein
VAAGQIAEGKLIVQAQCAACHALADAGITEAAKPVAPPLDGIGNGHDRAWLSAELVDACVHRTPKSRYACAQVHVAAAALSRPERDAIVDYLLTLRSPAASGAK